jgi:hypothetical protein
VPAGRPGTLPTRSDSAPPAAARLDPIEPSSAAHRKLENRKLENHKLENRKLENHKLENHKLDNHARERQDHRADDSLARYSTHEPLTCANRPKITWVQLADQPKRAHVRRTGLAGRPYDIEQDGAGVGSGTSD